MSKDDSIFDGSWFSFSKYAFIVGYVLYYACETSYDVEQTQINYTSLSTVILLNNICNIQYAFYVINYECWRKGEFIKNALLFWQ